MLSSRAGTRLSRGILLRARLGAGGKTGRRTYSASSFRPQQHQQQPLSSTQLKSHITNSSGKGIAFEDVGGSMRPGFTSRIKIELNRGPATFDSIFLRDS